MKIGFDASDVCTNRADGTTRYTQELLERLPALIAPHELHVFAPCPRPNHVPKAKNMVWHASPWPKWWTQLRLPFELFRVRPDVLFMPIQQLPIIRPSKMKTVSVIHDLAFHVYGEQTTYKDWLLLHAFTAQAARESNTVIAVSQSTADDIAHTYGRRKNVVVIPHGVDHTVFRLPTTEERESGLLALQKKYPKLRPPYILSVGQIQPRKNFIRLIKAFELLKRNHAFADFQLVIAGSHGWLQKKTFERVKKSPEKASIHMLGRVPDALLPALYWNASTFALVSLYEGFGLPVLEAMACGVPTVISSVSSLPEVAGRAAIEVNPHRAGSIRNGITQAIKDAERLKKNGIAQVKTFSWDTAAQAVASALTAYV